MNGEYLSIREAAAELGIEPERAIRLGWRLGIASCERCITLDDLQEIKSYLPEQRHQALVPTLLRSIQRTGVRPAR
jgi:hypothetical protein